MPDCAMPSRVPYVRVRDLSHSYATGAGPVHALARVSFNVRAGEVVSIVGASGCGKSTLLRLIGGLLPAGAGSVSIGGATPRDAQRAKAIGFVFQDPSLLPWRTVATNIRLPIDVGRRGGGRSTAGLLDLVGLTGFAGAYPHQLSGGMQQRAALARALATNPPLLLLDEPFGAVDEITREELRHDLLRVIAGAGATALLVTHSIVEAVLLSDRVLVLTARPGRLFATVAIDLPRPRTPDLETSGPFVALVRRLRDLLAAARALAPPFGGGAAGPQEGLA